MPTKHSRIPVTCDEELSEALARVEATLGRDVPRARLVHDLAVRGASAVVEETENRQAALDRLAVLSTDPRNPLFDREVLRRIDQEAWGYPAEDE
jgi:hypothetical protein